MYRNTKILCCSKHHKHKAFVEPFREQLNSEVHDNCDFDTDTLGTFTGDVPRLLTPKETVVKKAYAGLSSSHYDYAIATEATFTPHSSIPMLTIHHEIAVFVDVKRKAEYFVQRSSTETNFNKQEAATEDEVKQFWDTIGPPGHGIIVSPPGLPHYFVKDIKTLDDAISEYNNIKNNFNVEKVLLQTDMRAMQNPMRMAVIQELAHEMAERLRTKCPQCQHYGFGEYEKIFGKPCCDCGTPTLTRHGYHLKCTFCSHIEAQLDDGCALPTYCPKCNP